MAYEKTNWESREGYDLDRFEKANETAKSVILRNSPNTVTRPGTKFSVQNMNKIEQGIFDAHELAAAESQERQAAIETEAGTRASEDNRILTESNVYTDTKVSAASDELLDSINSIQAHVYKLTTLHNCLYLTADAFTDSYLPLDLPVSSVEGVLYDTQIKCNILLLILTSFQLSIVNKSILFLEQGNEEKPFSFISFL